MATIHQNLSDYSSEDVPNGNKYTIAIIRSEWNEDITQNLADGAESALLDNGVLEENIIRHDVPGAYELPLAAQWMANKPEIDAVVCIGTVIRGETSHFDFVSQAVSQGVKDVSLKTNKPIIFGVLTDDTKQQSIDRSGGILGNKGVEAGVTALKMLGLRDQL
ncbi:6,7-dimethyl-8-ribityllumazine synthase [bacterium SCSIO 12643]|nr:6,7-dimethyl-8-ribityllumazine synthase [bacterium SCSIO 12643]